LRLSGANVDGLQFSINGLDSLLGKLDSIKQETKRKGGRFALRKAAQIIRDSAKENAARFDDKETGREIAVNIVERWNARLFKRTGDLGFRIGVLHGAVFTDPSNKDTGYNGPTPHWRLLEFGTEKMKAQSFMRPAADKNINKVIDAFVSNYEKAIDRAIKRAQK
jgi:HK97 gp10 family phage protein